MIKPSPQWFIWAVGACFVIGLLLILLNYMDLLLPSAPSNWYLFGGLGAVLLGIIGLTQYR